jgi:DNA-binding transcriptional LysR family regulator
MRWDDWRIFDAAVEAKSFTKAARKLRLSVATVARRIDALEAAQGLRLLDRRTDGLSPTAHGLALHAELRTAALAMAQLERTADALRGGAWRDPVRISATEPVVVDILAPALPDLFRRAPDIRVDINSSIEIVSLAARAADIAVRFRKPEGNALICRQLPPLGLGLFAAKRLLDGKSADAFDYRKSRVVGYDDSLGPVPERTWIARSGLGDNLAARMSSTRALVAAVAAGVGIGILPRLMAARAVGLVELPVLQPIPDRPVWLVVHRDLARAKPMRIVRDWIADAFSSARQSASCA